MSPLMLGGRYTPRQWSCFLRLLLRLKCPSIKQIKTDREHKNAAIFVSPLIYTTIALPVGRLARVMTPVSPLKRPVISVHLLQMTR